MPLSAPASPRQRLHSRQVIYQGYQRADGLFDIEGRIVDVKDHDMPLLSGVRPAGEPVHDMWVRVTIDRAYTIRDIEAQSDRVPYPGGCDTIGPDYKVLVGANLLQGFRKRLHDAMGHVRSTMLAMACRGRRGHRRTGRSRGRARCRRRGGRTRQC